MEQKVILVTGASSGIGYHAALRLFKDGHIVYAVARRMDRLNRLKEIGVNTLFLDVTDEKSMFSCVNHIIRKHGRIDVLFNNAGYGLYGAVEDLSIHDAKHQFEVNLFGLARMIQIVLPHMRKEMKGRIINTSSIGGKIYSPLGAWYHASKHALEGFSDCLRLELKSFNIQVVLIQPGLIDTEFPTVSLSKVKDINDSPYKDMTVKLSKSIQEDVRLKKFGSHPNVIAKLVSKAVNAKHPKTRYVGGKMARTALTSRALLSDKMFDSILLNQFKDNKK